MNVCSEVKREPVYLGGRVDANGGCQIIVRLGNMVSFFYGERVSLVLKEIVYETYVMP